MPDPTSPASGSVSVETGVSSMECDTVDEVFIQSVDHDEDGSSLSGDDADGSSARSSEDERDDSYSKPVGKTCISRVLSIWSFSSLST